jgi:hypothetical protein
VLGQVVQLLCRCLLASGTLSRYTRTDAWLLPLTNMRVAHAVIWRVESAATFKASLPYKINLLQGACARGCCVHPRISWRVIVRLGAALDGHGPAGHVSVLGPKTCDCEKRWSALTL